MDPPGKNGNGPEGTIARRPRLRYHRLDRERQVHAEAERKSRPESGEFYRAIWNAMVSHARWSSPAPPDPGCRAARTFCGVGSRQDAQVDAERP